MASTSPMVTPQSINLKIPLGPQLGHPEATTGIMPIGNKSVYEGYGNGQVEHPVASECHHLDIFARLRETLFELRGVHVFLDQQDHTFGRGERGKPVGC